VTPPKPHVRPWREQMRARAVKLYLDGASGPEVARQLQVHPRTVYGYLHAAGVVRPRGATAKAKGRLRGLHPDEVDRTIEAYQSGLSTYEVAELLGITHTAVNYRLRHAGVPIRARHESLRLRFARRARAT
jgi:DNA-binding CsgD family transcriptional regulator